MVQAAANRAIPLLAKFTGDNNRDDMRTTLIHGMTPLKRELDLRAGLPNRSCVTE